LSAFICQELTIRSADKQLVDISFATSHSLALVGQSGSGKSLTLKALLSLLPSTLEAKMSIQSPFTLLRGESVTLVPQNPFTAFSPLTKIVDHFGVDVARSKEMMRLVNLDEALLERFPPELSGGQLQRVAIALALLPKPKLLLLDEPTTALDSKSKQHIIDLVVDLQKELGFLMIFVSHDIKSVKKVCEDIVVLKNGKVVESGKMEQVLANSKDPYTSELIASGFEMRQRRS
jgi:peptide/nickel transport system ATP-binding protein